MLIPNHSSMNPLSSRWQQIGSMFWNYFWLLQPTHVQYMYPSFHTLFVLHALVATKRFGAFYESSRHGLQTVHPSMIHMWITRCVQWPKDSRYGAPLSLPSVWSSYKACNRGTRMWSRWAATHRAQSSRLAHSVALPDRNLLGVLRNIEISSNTLNEI